MKKNLITSLISINAIILLICLIVLINKYYRQKIISEKMFKDLTKYADLWYKENWNKCPNRHIKIESEIMHFTDNKEFHFFKAKIDYIYNNKVMHTQHKDKIKFITIDGDHLRLIFVDNEIELIQIKVK